jgi:hypothetical protein
MIKTAVASAVLVTATITGLLVGGGDASSATPARARTFANCTAMHRVYPHGVGRTNAHDHVTSGKPVTDFKRSDPLYAANTKSDRDHDHIACEAH